MKQLKERFSIIAFVFFATACNSSQTNNVANNDSANASNSNSDTAWQTHPGWVMQGNIYEVNTRQYTSEGTFKAFEKNLDRLKEMGVQTLWFMPINPISKVDRKGTLGSYYAVADYDAINTEYGTMDDWKSLVKDAHDKGFKVIIDWVPNHTGADHPWLTKHPDFYVKDSSGKAKIAFDWADVRQLNYKNEELCDSMIAAMKYWITQSDIDGFRCDVAGAVPASFWKKCINELHKQKNVFMLAEADSAALHRAGFDATYTWSIFNVMKKIVKGESVAIALDTALQKADSTLPANALRMYFTSNHDENSWSKADYGTMPGATHAPFAVLTQTLNRSVPLIYSGQEEPLLRKLEFFEKDPIKFGKYARANFYKTLLNLRKNNEALSADASFKKVSAGDAKAVYAFVREKNGKKIFVILNLSTNPQTIAINDASLQGEAMNIFMQKKETLSNKTWKMEPWGYAVYEY